MSTERPWPNDSNISFIEAMRTHFPNLDLFDMTKEDLIPECSGIVGGAHLIEAIMEEDCKVMTY